MDGWNEGVLVTGSGSEQTSLRVDGTGWPRMGSGGIQGQGKGPRISEQRALTC